MGRIVEQENFKIDFDTIKNAKDFILIYHDDEDTLFVQPEEPRPAVSFDWNGDVWFRIDPNNGSIVGLEIDDFESIFLKKYPELANAWKEIKPLYRRRKRNTPEETSWQAFLRILVEFLRELVTEKPQQAQLAI